MQSREAPPTPRPDVAFRRQYETLRALLRGNGTALRLMADLEADLGHQHPAEGNTREALERLADEVLLMAEELNLMTGNRHAALYGVVEEIRGRIRLALADLRRDTDSPLAVHLTEEAAFDSFVVGGKAAGLAALRQVNPDLIPDGFVITTSAYRLFIQENDLAGRIRHLLDDLDVMIDHPRFRERTTAIRDLILNAEVPAAVREAITREAACITGSTGLWAVRSSALSEGGEGLSFAGQFDSRLNVAAEDLAAAYRAVLASRFSDRAITYRLHFGLREVDTPMAVLFMPMIAPRAAGAVYTRDPSAPAAETMVVCAVPGTADRMVRGEEEAETHRVPLPPGSGPMMSAARAGDDRSMVLSAEDVDRITRVAAAAVRVLGQELDIEWAMDEASHLWLVQGRRLHLVQPERHRETHRRRDPPLLERGFTLFPGRAEGMPEHLREGDPLRLSHTAPVLVIDQASPSFAPLLPRVAAVLIARGNPVGHLATVIRELRVPAVIDIGDGAKLLADDETISVDATQRRVFRGSRWPDVRERVLRRVTDAASQRPGNPVYDLVLALNLTDAHGSDFKAKRCRSLHDVVRFVHEMSVRAMFRFGDRQNRFWKRAVKKLDSRLPLKLKLLDLDGCSPPDRVKVAPEEVASRPLRALFRGVLDSRVSWRQRTLPDLVGLPSDFVESVLGGASGPRRKGADNYAIVAADYLNLNARFAYHYAMLDAVVGKEAQSNHVHIRFRGGGADDARRARRARFLEIVLRTYHFGVDRRGDLITAWLRNQPPEKSEQALEMLGRLMGCARQLDMLLSSDAMVKSYVRTFLDQDYTAFA